jgi:hypothetical protein
MNEPRPKAKSKVQKTTYKQPITFWENHELYTVKDLWTSDVLVTRKWLGRGATAALTVARESALERLRAQRQNIGAIL